MSYFKRTAAFVATLGLTLTYSAASFAKGGEGAYASINFLPEESSHIVVKNLGDGWEIDTDIQKLVFHVHGSTGKQRKFKSWKTIVGPKGDNEQSFSQIRRSFSHGRTNKASDYNGDGVIDQYKSLGNQTRGSKDDAKRHVIFEGPTRRFFRSNAIKKICEDAFLASIPGNRRNNNAYKDANRGKFSTTKMIGIEAHTEMVVTAPPSTKWLYRRASTWVPKTSFTAGGIPQNFKVVCKAKNPARQPSTVNLVVNQAFWNTSAGKNEVVLAVRNNGKKNTENVKMQVRISEGPTYTYWGEIKALKPGESQILKFSFPRAKHNINHKKSDAKKAEIFIFKPYKQTIDLLKKPILPVG